MSRSSDTLSDTLSGTTPGISPGTSSGASPSSRTWTWKRTLRTPSSERFLAVEGAADIAAVDVHYLANGVVAGTVFVLEDARLIDADIPRLLQSLDDDMLPGANAHDGTVLFTLVRGIVLGSFESTMEDLD